MEHKSFITFYKFPVTVVGMGYKDLKLLVDLEAIQEELRYEIANIEKTGVDTFSGNWINDSKVYENVVIPFRLGFIFNSGGGSNCDAHLNYTVYYIVDDLDALYNQLFGVLDDGEIVALRNSVSITEMAQHEERVSFYDLEIV